MSDYTKLAIVGNGFDLAHGLKTNYYDFVEDRIKICISLGEFEKEVENTLKNQNYEKEFSYYKSKNEFYWYDFEQVIGETTNVIFQEYLMKFSENPKDNQEIQKIYEMKMHKINSLFEEVTTEFYEYLRKEVSGFIEKKIDNIAAELDNQTFVINFNYTSTVETYTKNIRYIHGSLFNNDLPVFGFPMMTRFDFPDTLSETHNKAYQRDLLHFSRHIRNNKGINFQSDKYKNLIEEMKYVHIPSLHSGKGGYGEIQCAEIEEYSGVNGDFTFKEENEYDSDKITEVIFLGHSIIADTEVLGEIFEELSNLEQIVIYSYSGESEATLDNKVKMIKEIAGQDSIVTVKFFS
ncbi:AbiH family protein [Trichococcus shcherbakoviae]|nr:AbiH family protein [Trichococcus shcherbakoviae]